LKLLSRVIRPVLVMVLFMLCFSSVAMAETETETQTRTASSDYGTQQYLSFAMVASRVSGTPYPVGNGSAEIRVEGTSLSVHFDAEGMAKSAHLTLVLLASGTSHSVANMTTSHDGEVEAEATVSLGIGSYSVGLQVFDTSTFSSPTQVLMSNPSAQPLSLYQSTQVSSTTTTEQAQTATTVPPVPEGDTEKGDIRTAIQSKVIPAVVDVGESGSNTFVNDGNFSISVGRYQQDGYLVSIYAANVVGPRVLLVNLTSAQARSLFSAPFQIALDGSAIPQASVLSQVLAASPGDPAQFVLVAGPTALKLLVLIPHFSYHTISIVPILVHALAAMQLYVPALLISVAAVTAVLVAAYSRRTRVEL
jgi:hypothetical protein